MPCSLLRGEVACDSCAVQHSTFVVAWVQRGMALAAALVMLLAALAARERQRPGRSYRTTAERPRTLPRLKVSVSAPEGAPITCRAPLAIRWQIAGGPPVAEPVQRQPGRVQPAPAGAPLRARVRRTAAASASRWPTPIILYPLVSWWSTREPTWFAWSVFKPLRHQAVRLGDSSPPTGGWTGTRTSATPCSAAGRGQQVSAGDPTPHRG
jgi:hypothetical protein